MRALRTTPSRVYLFSIGALALLIVAFAIAKNSDVKAGFKMLGIELSIEARPTLTKESAERIGRSQGPGERSEQQPPHVPASSSSSPLTAPKGIGQ